MPRKQAVGGFTLIEVLIVVMVIAIITAIAVPRMMGAVLEARGATMRADLQKMRCAIRLFEATHGGHPCRLEHLMSYTAPGHCHADGTGDKIDLLPDTPWDGPYLTTGDGGLPVDPITLQAFWGYRKSTGRVRSNASGTALDGTAYSDF